MDTVGCFLWFYFKQLLGFFALVIFVFFMHHNLADLKYYLHKSLSFILPIKQLHFSLSFLYYCEHIHSYLFQYLIISHLDIVLHLGEQWLYYILHINTVYSWTYWNLGNCVIDGDCAISIRRGAENPETQRWCVCWGGGEGGRRSFNSWYGQNMIQSHNIFSEWNKKTHAVTYTRDRGGEGVIVEQYPHHFLHQN